MTDNDKSNDGHRASFGPTRGEDGSKNGGPASRASPKGNLGEAAAPQWSQPAPPSRAGPGEIGVGETLIGRFRLSKLMARGRTGEVFEAEDIEASGQRVAIKVFSSDLARDDSVRTQIANATSTLTRIEHEAIVAYREAAFDPWGRPFVVMEFIDGPSVEERLGNIWLSDEQFSAMAIHLASGLGVAHRLGMVHRGIAPDSILLAGGDPMRCKIIDFAIAAAEPEDGFVGKFKYVAPEQLGEYDGQIGPWTDLYSLALTLLAIASGRDVDMGDSIAEAVRKRLWLPDLAAIPSRYRLAFERALHPEPAMRPRSMDDFINLLKEVRTRGGTSSASTDAHELPAQSPLPSAGTGASSGAVSQAPLTGRRIPKWALIGSAAAIFLVATVLVVMLATGGDVGLRKGDKSGIDSATPEIAALATSLANRQPCAWLTFEPATGKGPQFVGGAGNRSDAQSAIMLGLADAQAGGGSVGWDEVVSFDQSLCGAIDALRQFRANDDLVTSPKRTYVAAEKDMILSDEYSLGQGMWTQPLLRVGGLQPDEDLILLVIEAGSKMQPLFSGREAGEGVVQLLSGTVTQDGFEVPYPAKLEQPPKEGYGIAVVAGKGPFPVDLFGDANDSSPRVPLDAGWPDRFGRAARAHGWRTDIFWFSVTDGSTG
ncbi:serine/threonine protein kinase [Tsuneonella sp. YG55]|uniref:Serine/threonine protein kinase n=1 Tax=Tsuneonella litorea TaxID=2976475 RepID=A0A9X3AL83_9SPHN|nr:serine/threonine-protein kinase [Tsuneonella litorea]MCT2559399.1 serine/threonine protein kinase [Tsuneonella litorea]